jgi:3,4-dihydroxy 2-butanone 4-phosphate synthase/GTP cyclohydrolase II
MTRIDSEGRGVLLYMRQEGRGIGLINKLKALRCRIRVWTPLRQIWRWASRTTCANIYRRADFKGPGGQNPPAADQQPAEGIRLSGFGLEIVERLPIQIEATAYDAFYLKTKQKKMEHFLDYLKGDY